jgi:hypothetical protein
LFDFFLRSTTILFDLTTSSPLLDLKKLDQQFLSTLLPFLRVFRLANVRLMKSNLKPATDYVELLAINQ